MYFQPLAYALIGQSTVGPVRLIWLSVFSIFRKKPMLQTNSLELFIVSVKFGKFDVFNYENV